MVGSEEKSYFQLNLPRKHREDTGASGFGQQTGVNGSVPVIKRMVVLNGNCSLRDGLQA